MQSGFTLNRFSAFTVERPTLDQFVLLSLMLHVLVIVLFGDTTGGGARRGEKLWGALTVTVQSLLPDRNAALKSDAEKTVLQRTAPDAPKTNTSARDALTPTEPVPAAEEPMTAMPASSFEMPPVIAKEVDKPVTEFVVPKASVDRAPGLATPTQVSPPIAPVPRETPPAIAKPEPVAPPKIERVPATPIPLVPPVEPTPPEEAVATPVPKLEIPAPPPQRPEPPLPKIEREIVKPVVAAPEPKPREVIQPPTLTVPVAPITPIATPKPEPERVQTIAPPAEVKPREIPAAVPPAPALAAPSAPQPAQPAKTPQIERDATTPIAPPDATKAAPTRAPAVAPGASNADGDLVKPRGDAIAPSTTTTAPGKTPGIDLDAVRRRAREIGGSGPRTVFPFPVAPQPVPKTKVQEAFDKALKKNDCRDAYADLGLAAVVPLVLSAVREDGCRW